MRAPIGRAQAASRAVQSASNPMCFRQSTQLYDEPRAVAAPRRGMQAVVSRQHVYVIAELERGGAGALGPLPAESLQSLAGARPETGDQHVSFG